jgi:hypothetical protein
VNKNPGNRFPSTYITLHCQSRRSKLEINPQNPSRKCSNAATRRTVVFNWSIKTLAWAVKKVPAQFKLSVRRRGNSENRVTAWNVRNPKQNTKLCIVSPGKQAILICKEKARPNQKKAWFIFIFRDYFDLTYIILQFFVQLNNETLILASETIYGSHIFKASWLNNQIRKKNEKNRYSLGILSFFFFILSNFIKILVCVLNFMSSAGKRWKVWPIWLSEVVNILQFRKIPLVLLSLQAIAGHFPLHLGLQTTYRIFKTNQCYYFLDWFCWLRVVLERNRK